MNSVLPDPIIVRTCPEHRVKLFNERRLWEYGLENYRHRKDVTPMKHPKRDYEGRLLVANVNEYFLDDTYPANHKRHIVLHVHWFLTEDGKIGASEKRDPK